jgi:hypothetical protein
MADAADSKSAAPCGRVGSTPISGTNPFPSDRNAQGRPRGGTALVSRRGSAKPGGGPHFLPWSTSIRAAVLSPPDSV